ncbi:hypothetical protein D3C76_1453220 [compost metagenome]
MCLRSACSTVALNAASNGRLAPSRLASCRVAQARSLSESLAQNKPPPLACAVLRSSCTCNAVSPRLRNRLKAAPWLSASKCPDSILPWASAASKR